jgi:hypothetical protein
LVSIESWFDRIDPGTHRRIKGLRLVTAFGLAALLAIVPQISRVTELTMSSPWY